MHLPANKLTPCGAMFSLLKREGGITNRDLADLVLSERPLPSGRSARDLARDRSWLSHSVVHAPADSLQERYFRDFGSAAVRVMGRLRSRRGRAMGADEVLSVLTGEPGRAMDAALTWCHQDARLYRNALERLAGAEDLVPGERAEAALVLFVAAGCCAQIERAVDYALDYAASSFGGRVSTPVVTALAERDDPGSGVPAAEAPLGLIRVEGGYVAGGPHWIASRHDGTEIGSLATGEGAVTDVGRGVSGHHARVWRDEGGGWLVEDLGSTNGTVIVSGTTHEATTLEPGTPAPLRAADQLVLAGDTTFVAVEGLAGGA